MKARHIRRILFFLMVLTAVLLLCSPAQAADNISAGSFRSEDGKTRISLGGDSFLCLKEDVLLVQGAGADSILKNSDTFILPNSIMIVRNGAAENGSPLSLQSGQKVCLWNVMDPDDPDWEGSRTFYGYIVSVSGNRVTLKESEKQTSEDGQTAVIGVDFIDSFQYESPETNGHTADFDVKIPFKEGANVVLKGYIDLNAGGGGSISGATLGVDFWFTIAMKLERYGVQLKDMKGFDINKEIKSIQIELIPGVVQVSLAPNVFLRGSAADGEFYGNLYFKEGFRVRASIGFQFPPVQIDCELKGHESPSAGLDECNVKGDVYFGIFVGPHLELLEGAVKLGLSYRGGVAINGGIGKEWDSHGGWHVCGNQCIDGKANMRIGPLTVDVALLYDKFTKSFDLFGQKDFDPFAQFYRSLRFGDGGKGICPHRGYKLNVKVTTSAGTAARGAKVSYTDVPEGFSTRASGTADNAGNVILWAPAGKINVHAKATSRIDPSVTAEGTMAVNKRKQDDSVTLKLQLKDAYIRFADPATGGHASWPEDIAFTPFMSQDVILPDTVPTKPGYVFTGWNTAADGSGTSYAPGSKIISAADMTLYAQWRLAGNSWYVVFNANGGATAPDSLVVPLGTDAAIPADVPWWDSGVEFLGWSRDRLAEQPEITAGGTLAYDSSVTFVTLYAVWKFPPVERPVQITFDANGVEAAVLPDPVWITPYAWFQLKAAVPPAGDYRVFIGWDTDPESTEAKYSAQKAYQFGENAALWAIWRPEYRITSGAGSIWQKNTRGSLRFVANGPLDKFTGVRIDGNLLSASKYIASSGSTVIVLPPDTLQNLAADTHTITVVYRDGEASAPFTVRPAIPKTGDTENPGLWILMLLTGLAGIVLCMLFDQKSVNK